MDSGQWTVQLAIQPRPTLQIRRGYSYLKWVSPATTSAPGTAYFEIARTSPKPATLVYIHQIRRQTILHSAIVSLVPHAWFGDKPTPQLVSELNLHQPKNRQSWPIKPPHHVHSVRSQTKTRPLWNSTSNTATQKEAPRHHTMKPRSQIAHLRRHSR